MNKVLLGFLIGVLSTLLILNHLNWSIIFTPTIIKFSFSTFLALLAGLIALYQVKSNVISTARIKWIEEFKNNVSEYIASINEAIFAYQIHLRGDKNETEFYAKYFIAINKSGVFENKIRLNLNLDEELHLAIDNELTEVKNIIINTNGKITREDEDKLNMKFQSIAEHTSKSLKIEWEKSKKMFYFRWWNKLNNDN